MKHGHVGQRLLLHERLASIEDLELSCLSLVDRILALRLHIDGTLLIYIPQYKLQCRMPEVRIVPAQLDHIAIEIRCKLELPYMLCGCGNDVFCICRAEE